MRRMHQKVHFETENKKYYFKNGLHQGSPISPALFNIYMEDYLLEMKVKFREGRGRVNDLKYLGYADDLVFSCLHSDIPILTKVLKELGDKYNLKLNPRKSNWMRIRKHGGRELTTRET